MDFRAVWQGGRLSQVEVLEGAEAFALGDGPVGALLIHGFTGSPQSMRGLGEYLADHGVAVECPRLPGHGTTWQDLNTFSDADWTRTVEDAFSSLSTDRDEVFVVALSFGAALAVELVARHQQKINGLVTIAGFVQTKDPRRFLSPLIKRVAASLPGMSNDIADPDQKEIAYGRLPTAATACMLNTLKRARASLPQIDVPILIMHGRNDHTVLPFNAEVIHDSVASKDKELVWMERSYHVLTLDYDREDVFERTLRFIARHSALEETSAGA